MPKAIDDISISTTQAEAERLQERSLESRLSGQPPARRFGFRIELNRSEYRLCTVNQLMVCPRRRIGNSSRESHQ
jgi:hypothetical protein